MHLKMIVGLAASVICSSSTLKASSFTFTQLEDAFAHSQSVIHDTQSVIGDYSCSAILLDDSGEKRFDYTAEFTRTCIGIAMKASHSDGNGQPSSKELLLMIGDRDLEAHTEDEARLVLRRHAQDELALQHQDWLPQSTLVTATGGAIPSPIKRKAAMYSYCVKKI